MRKFLILLLVIALVLLGASGAIIFLFANQFVHPRHYAVQASPDVINITNWRDVTFDTADGLTLRGWFVPSQRADKTTILFVHGISGNRTNFLEQVHYLYEQGYGALLFDLRNHGSSDGNITTMGENEVLDVQAAYAFLAEQPEIESENVVIFSHSMGGATAILALPTLPQIRGLIVDTAYTSMEDVTHDGVRNVIGGSFFVHHLILSLSNRLSGHDLYRVRPIDVIGEIAPRPILFIHGRTDTRIPVEHIFALHEAAGEPKDLLIIEGAEHIVSFYVDPTAYKNKVLAFLDGIFQPRANAD